ncbi:MAG: hypothetical protein HMLKMBBP_00779 [Planctomycetes bacterium]|nr:hypothetical protein [Planctomycetota bacterium]
MDTPLLFRIPDVATAHPRETTFLSADTAEDPLPAVGVRRHRKAPETPSSVSSPSTSPPFASPPFASATSAPTPRGGPPPALRARGVTFDRIPARTALTRQTGPQAAWFDWSANPFRGCEYACGYCYARPTHAWLGHADPRDFQERIYVKEGFVAALRRELRTKVEPGQHIAFGTATDPYQPVERREGQMRGALRELAQARGLRVSITTKSNVVLRDIDLLRKVAESNSLRVNVTVTTPDARLARLLEPKAPTPSARIGVVRALSRAGVRAGLFLMPVLPGITDGDADLRHLLGSMREAGAAYVAHQTVFLEGSARPWLLGRLRAAYPRVAARYEMWTRAGRTLPAEVRQDVAARVGAIARAVGLATRMDPSAPGGRRECRENQRTFGFLSEPA